MYTKVYIALCELGVMPNKESTQLEMDYKTEDIDIEEKLAVLNLPLPTNLTFFPENFDTVLDADSFIFPDSVSDLKKVFRQNNIQIGTLGNAPVKLRARKYADWFGPTLFFSLTMLAENPTIVSISLNVLSNYLTDFFKESLGEKKVHLEIYVETKRKKKKVTRITYTGGIDGIQGVEKVIKSLKS
jgi:hypothetical protein